MNELRETRRKFREVEALQPRLGEPLSDEIDTRRKRNEPVLDRRCICVFCFGAALLLALEVALALVDVATAIATGGAFATFAALSWWLGDGVDICTLTFACIRGTCVQVTSNRGGGDQAWSRVQGWGVRLE